MAYPRFLRARAIKVLTRTSGDYTAGSGNGGVRTAVDAGNWDIALPAAVGDVLEVGILGHFQSAAVVSHLDIGTIIGTTYTNSVSGTSIGNNNQMPGTFTPSGVDHAFNSFVFYTVTAADISSGKVTVRLYRTEESAVDRTLEANTTRALQMYARNLGPVSPH